MPRAPYATTLLEDDEIVAVLPLDKVYRSAHARYTGSYDDHCRIRVVLVAYRYLWPGFVATWQVCRDDHLHLRFLE